MAQYTECVCGGKYLQNVHGKKNDQATMKNVSGKTMLNNYAECAWETDVSVYTECVWENNLVCYFKSLLMLCFYNIHNKYSNENFE